MASGLLLALTTIAIGFYSDDWMFIARLEHRIPAAQGPLDLYRFTLGVDRARADVYPWFASAALKIDFFRPLSSALFALDHALFGQAPLPYHLHAIAWFAAFLVAAWLVLRRALPGALGVLAFVLFAIDDSHMQAAGWISCRHLLVATTPALFGLAAHLEARERGWTAGRWLGPLGLVVGLFGGESALGVVAFFVAYELVGRPNDAFRTRFASLLPIVGVALAYLALYRATGHGAKGNDFYLEPFSDPVGFARAALVRLPILMGDLLLGVPTELASLFAAPPFVVLGVAAIVGATLLVRAVMPRIDTEERRGLAWLSLGGFGALVAALGGFPGSRLLSLPSLGGLALVAAVLRYGWLEASKERALRVGAWIVAGVHLVLAPLGFVGNAAGLAGIARGTEAVAASIDLDPSRAAEVFVLSGSDPMATIYAGVCGAARQTHRITGWTFLSLSKHSHRVTRLGARSLRLEPTEGTLLDGLFVGVFRSEAEPMRVGDAFLAGSATVRVLSVVEGKPKTIAIDFPRDLDDPALAFLALREGQLRAVKMPAVGSTIELPFSPGPTGLM